MLCSGEAGWSFGVFFKSLQAEFLWSRSVTSIGYVALIAGLALSTFWAGRAADRHNMRSVLLLSAALGGAALVTCSQIRTPLEFALCLFLAGLGTGATVSVPPYLVQKWFFGRTDSGMALALVMCGVGAGALIFAPLLNFVTQNWGWRPGFMVAGIAFFLLAGLSAPVLCGGTPPTSGGTRGSATTGNSIPQPESRRSLFLNGTFIVALVMQLVAQVSFQTLSVHLVPYATDQGISSTASAVALGLIGGLSIPGRLLVGVLSRRLGYRATLWIALTGAALTFLFLPFVDSSVRLNSFVVIYALCHGIRAVAVLGFIGQIFGVRSLGLLTGTVMAVSQLAGALAPYVAGYVFDHVGSYVVTFVILGVALGISGMLALKVGTPKASSMPR
jgi:MFS family permease